jgi:hypothetical protein
MGNMEAATHSRKCVGSSKELEVLVDMGKYLFHE